LQTGGYQQTWPTNRLLDFLKGHDKQEALSTGSRNENQQGSPGTGL
jgi:hypothetical protein